MEFSEDDKQCIQDFLRNVGSAGINSLSSEAELLSFADDHTKTLIEKVLALNPEDYGFRGKLLPTEKPPSDAVRITGDTTAGGGEYELDRDRYLPQQVFSAFEGMAAAFNEENPGRQLLVGSGYRSPAFQVVTLLYILANVYDFDLDLTLTRVAMPNYSQHCSVSHTAIDIANIDGEPDDSDPQNFSDSIEYAWLLNNAHTFGFRESYPKGNPDGIMWEPWHWQYMG